MKVKALKSFAGVVSMHANEIKNIANESIAKSLIACGYAEKVAETAKKLTTKESGKKQ